MACSDIELVKVVEHEGPEDTGEVWDPETHTTDIILERECYDPLPDYVAVVAPGNGWTTYSEAACAGTRSFSFDPNVLLVPGGAKVHSFEIAGSIAASGNLSESPADNPVRLLQAVWQNDAEFGWDDADNLASSDIEAPGPPGLWTGLSGDLNNLDACHPVCEYVLAAEVQDPARSYDATDTSFNECEDYDAMSVCVTWEHTESSRTAPTESTCSAGTGTFTLVPRRAIDRDLDGAYSLVLVPIQTSGTGAPTNAAWINKITVLESQGQALRAIKVNKSYRFDTTDQLVDPVAVSRLLSAQGTVFPNGVVSGGAPFVAVEVPGATTLPLTVSMEWSCGTLLPQEDIAAPTGYTFDLADLGCPGAWPQLFTIRPLPLITPNHLSLERYGSVADHRVIRLVDDVGGSKTFTWSASHLKVSGTFVSASPAAGAVIDLDEVSWRGISLCQPGTYVLPPEG